MCKEKNKRYTRDPLLGKVFSAGRACLYPFHPDSKNYETCHLLTKNSYEAC